MGKLRDQMVSDLLLRNYSHNTVQAYTWCMVQFVKHFRRSPERMGKAEIREFLLYLAQERKLSPATRRLFVVAIKFFYRVTLNRAEEVQTIPYPKIPKTLPDILTQEEVATLLDAVKSVKYRAIITTTYAAGLRITEACRLLARGDIDSQRMLIHVRDGKGAKDRYVVLGDRLLAILREYWMEIQPKGLYLFPGRHPDCHTNPMSVYQVFRKALKKTGITKRVTLHTLRHCYATHLAEAHTDIRVIQALLGHCSIRTTARYTQVSAELIGGTRSPYDAAIFEKNAPAA